MDLRRLAAILLSLLFLQACSEGPGPKRLDLAGPDLRSPSMPSPTLDVSVPRLESAEVIFARIEDKPLLTSPVNTARKQERRPVRFQQEQEPNNSRDEAAVIQLSGELLGYIHPPLAEDRGDEDWFRTTVDLDRQQVLTAVLEPVPGIDLALEIWKQGVTGGPERVLKLDSYGAGQGEQVGNYALSNGTYYFLVTSRRVGDQAWAWNVRDPWRLRFSTVDPSPDRELEPDNDPRRANRIRLGTSVSASLMHGDTDWFWIPTARLGLKRRLSMDIVPGMKLDLSWRLQTPDRVVLLSGRSGPGRRVLIPNLAIIPDVDGLYLVVDAPGTLEGMIEYSVTFTDEALEGLVETEPNGQIRRSVAVSPPATATGWLHGEGDRDIYRLSVPEALALTVQVDGIPGVRLALALLDSQGEVITEVLAPEAGASVALPNLWLEQGDTWLQLSSREGASPLVPYKLVLEKRSAENEEREPNDSLEKGGIIDPGAAPLTGFIGLAGDRDCFIVSDPGSEPFVLEIRLEERGDRELRMVVYDTSDMPMEQITVRKGSVGSVQAGAGRFIPKAICVEAPGGRFDPGMNGYSLEVKKRRPEPLDDGR